MTVNWNKSVRLPEFDDLDALLPQATLDFVGDRREIVIYTGWTVADDGTLLPMDPEKD